MRLWDGDEQQAEPPDHSGAEHIIMIGSSRLTSLYIKLVQAHPPAQRHVVAVLDNNHKLFGRTMCGVPLVGAADQLDAVIEEFAVHGVDTDRVIIGGDETLLSAATLDAVRNTCAQRDIVVDFVPSLIGLAPLPKARRAAALRLAQALPRPQYQPPAYFWYKRIIDFIVALVAIVIFFARVPTCLGLGSVRLRRAGGVLAKTYWPEWQKPFAVQIPNAPRAV